MGTAILLLAMATVYSQPRLRSLRCAERSVITGCLAAPTNGPGRTTIDNQRKLGKLEKGLVCPQKIVCFVVPKWNIQYMFV